MIKHALISFAHSLCPSKLAVLLAPLGTFLFLRSNDRCGFRHHFVFKRVFSEQFLLGIPTYTLRLRLDFYHKSFCQRVSTVENDHSTHNTHLSHQKDGLLHKMKTGFASIAPFLLQQLAASQPHRELSQAILQTTCY